MALNKNVVVLVGGVGGAKLAYGLQQVLASERLTIVVNTADDFWLYGLRICPDLDTIMYTLGGRVDKINGWGVANDTTQALNAMQRYGEETWFRLGDIDLGTHILRTDWLRNGLPLTEVTAKLSQGLGIGHRILPMSDDIVATHVDTVEHGEMDFQEYFVRHRWQPTMRGLRYTGAEAATTTTAVRTAIQAADMIIVGPSNPWLSISPILAIPGLREAIATREVPRVAVSPLVGGDAVKGPTAKLMRELGYTPVNAETIARYYGDVVNAFVYDETEKGFDVQGLHATAMNTLMRTDRDKIALAENILDWIAQEHRA